MKIITDTIDFKLDKESAVAIGKFDGVHIGHRKLLANVLEKKKQGLLACVITFWPAPSVLFGFSDGRELLTREEKRLVLEKMGVDVLIEFPMTRETAAMAPDYFAGQILGVQMRARYVAAGSDLSFGDRGAGNTELLIKIGKECGFDVETIDKVCAEGREVSSSYIRSLVEEGRMQEAESLLGMPFPVHGEVVHGNHLGSGIGFPTVNLLPGETKLLPPYGVYFSAAVIDGKVVKGISNVGCKPTVEKKPVPGVETYLYDFDRDIYGQTITVYLFAFRRPERKFDNLDALVSQLKEDITAGEKKELTFSSKFLL